MFSPIQGRFLSMDPMAADGIVIEYEHPYAYARNNPVNNIDPSGMQTGEYKLPFKVCAPKFGPAKPLDPKRPVDPRTPSCPPDGPGHTQSWTDSAGNEVILECKRTAPGAAFAIHYTFIRKGKPPQQFATCVYPLAFNKLIGLCDANGVFVGLVNYNIGVLPGDAKQRLDQFHALEAACTKLDLSKSRNAAEAAAELKKCVDDYVKKQLGNVILKECNEAGQRGEGRKPCVRIEATDPGAG